MSRKPLTPLEPRGSGTSQPSPLGEVGHLLDILVDADRVANHDIVDLALLQVVAEELQVRV